MAKLIQPIATAAGYYFGGPVGALVGSQVGGTVQSELTKPDTPAAAAPAPPVAEPTVTTPTEMPTADSSAVAAAKKKSIIEQMAARGRASTILTDTATSDKLGG